MGVATSLIPPLAAITPPDGPLFVSAFDSEYLVPVPVALALVPVGMASVVAGWHATIGRPLVLGIVVAIAWFGVGMLAWAASGAPGLAGYTATVLVAMSWDCLRQRRGHAGFTTRPSVPYRL